jgi:hypothetical protein
MKEMVSDRMLEIGHLTDETTCNEFRRQQGQSNQSNTFAVA